MKLRITGLNRIAVLMTMLYCLSSCVKEALPPDCKKPGKPTINTPVSLKEGDTLRLSASGSSSGAQYVWSGPNNFYSSSPNPQINFATIANGGTYWLKALVGYCYSDSVSTIVTVKGDTTCNLGDNGAEFPNGSGGAFSMKTSCSSGSNGYQINSERVDSSISVLIKMAQKPTKRGVYTLTNNPNPANGQIFYQIKDIYGNIFYNTTFAPCYVKVGNGKINIVICQIPFEHIGVFSANISCH